MVLFPPDLSDDQYLCRWYSRPEGIQPRSGELRGLVIGAAMAVYTGWLIFTTTVFHTIRVQNAFSSIVRNNV